MKTKDAARYLSLYVGESDWERHITERYKQLAKSSSEAQAKNDLRKSVACATLLPIYDRYKVPDPPENLLFWCKSFRQYGERDWEALLVETMERDTQIAKWRNQCQSLGIIDPIDYSPITRQAFNWLFSEAERSGEVTEENRQRIEQSFKRLVYTYGGAVICSIFQKHESSVRKKVLNWRSNYFFERLIFDIYSVDQVVKIKRQELKKTNPKLVKQIRKV